MFSNVGIQRDRRGRVISKRAIDTLNDGKFCVVQLMMVFLCIMISIFVLGYYSTISLIRAKESTSLEMAPPTISITEGEESSTDILSNQSQQDGAKEISFFVLLDSLPEEVFIRQTIANTASTASRSDTEDTNPILFFLHGAAYTSGTWSELGILSDFAVNGYSSYAIDVPGYGKSGRIHAKGDQWLRDLIDILFPQKRGSETMISIKEKGGMDTAGRQMVVVTASMSGQYAIPLLIEEKEDPPQQMVGMVTVAPANTDAFNADKYRMVTTPICIVYGENDHNLGLASKKNLIDVPNHKVVVVPQGEHAAYKTNPAFFVQEVTKFLQK